jgi:hypothetical protein
MDYQHLCQACPQFKETFRSHKDDYQHARRWKSCLRRSTA